MPPGQYAASADYRSCGVRGSRGSPVRRGVRQDRRRCTRGLPRHRRACFRLAYSRLAPHPDLHSLLLLARARATYHSEALTCSVIRRPTSISHTSCQGFPSARLPCVKRTCSPQSSARINILASHNIPQSERCSYSNVIGRAEAINVPFCKGVKTHPETV